MGKRRITQGKEKRNIAPLAAFVVLLAVFAVVFDQKTSLETGYTTLQNAFSTNVPTIVTANSPLDLPPTLTVNIPIAKETIKEAIIFVDEEKLSSVSQIYQKGKGSSILFSSIFAPPISKEGPHTLSLIITSFDGRKASFKQDFYVDNTAPIISIDEQKSVLLVTDETSLGKIEVYEINYGFIRYDPTELREINRGTTTATFAYNLPTDKDFIVYAYDGAGNLGRAAISALSLEEIDKKFDEEVKNNVKAISHIIASETKPPGSEQGGVDCDYMQCTHAYRILFMHQASKNGQGRYANWWVSDPNQRKQIIENSFRTGKAEFLLAVYANNVALPTISDFEIGNECPQYETTLISPYETYDAYSNPQGILYAYPDDDCGYCNRFSQSSSEYAQCQFACKQITRINKVKTEFYDPSDPSTEFDGKTVAYQSIVDGHNSDDALKIIRDRYFQGNKDVIPVIIVDQVLLSNPYTTIPPGNQPNGFHDRTSGMVVIAYEQSHYYDQFIKTIKHEVYGHPAGLLGHSSTADNIMFWHSGAPITNLDRKQSESYRAHARNCACKGTEAEGEMCAQEGFMPETAALIMETGYSRGEGCSFERDRMLTRIEGNPPQGSLEPLYPEECDNTYSEFIAPANVKTHELGAGTHENPLSFCPLPNPHEPILQQIFAISPSNYDLLRGRFGINHIKYCIPRGAPEDLIPCSCYTKQEIISKWPDVEFPPIPPPAAPPPAVTKSRTDVPPPVVSSPPGPTTAYCGDDILTPPEECDDGNIDDNDGCSKHCEIEKCGDGIVQNNEECEKPGDICDQWSYCDDEGSCWGGTLVCDPQCNCPPWPAPPPAI